MLKVQIKGIDEAKRKLHQLASMAEPMAKAALRDGAEIMQKAAQRRVVGGPNGAVGREIHIREGGIL